MTDTSRFITVEGIEGVGKTTAIDHIRRFLEAKGEPVLLTREPGGTPLAESVRQLILSHHDESLSADAELLLIFASRVQHVERVIRPALNDGQWVICDRFFDASFAYQGGGRRMDESRIQTLLDWSLGSFAPGLTLLLDAPLSVTMERLVERGTARDRIEQESWSFFERVRERYLASARAEPQRMTLIDASDSLEQVVERIGQSLDRYHQKLALEAEA